MELERLIKKYQKELLTFESLYKGTAIYSNDKIRINAQLEYRSEIKLHMTTSDLNLECDILFIEELIKKAQ